MHVKQGCSGPLVGHSGDFQGVIDYPCTLLRHRGRANESRIFSFFLFLFINVLRFFSAVRLPLYSFGSSLHSLSQTVSHDILLWRSLLIFSGSTTWPTPERLPSHPDCPASSLRAGPILRDSLNISWEGIFSTTYGVLWLL